MNLSTIDLDTTLFVKPTTFGITCTGLFAQDLDFFKFTADCTGARTIGATCALTTEDGYTGGNVECAQDGKYEATPAKATSWSYIYLLFIVALAVVVCCLLNCVRSRKQ